MTWLFVVDGLLLVIDRWLKVVAGQGASRDFGWAQFVLFRNDALVFSWPAPNWVAIVMMFAAMAAVAIVLARAWGKRRNVFVFGGLLILSGAFSNLFDRLAYGFVIDWVYLGPWWPVFNLADVMIGTGVVLWWWYWRRRLTNRTD